MLYLFILVVYTFRSRYFVLERSIYWDALSFVKGLLALRILEYKENFWRSLESFVNVLVHDCYASCLDILVDLVSYRHISCRGRIAFLQGSNLLWEKLWRQIASFLQVDRFIFQGVINCYSCIESFSLDDLHSFSFICESYLTSVVCFCRWRGHISSLGVLVGVPPSIIELIHVLCI